MSSLPVVHIFSSKPRATIVKLTHEVEKVPPPPPLPFFSSSSYSLKF